MSNDEYLLFYHKNRRLNRFIEDHVYHYANDIQQIFLGEDSKYFRKYVSNSFANTASFFKSMCFIFEQVIQKTD